MLPLEDTTYMQTTAHRLTSLWTRVRVQLRDSREAHATQTALEREPASYRTPGVLSGLSHVPGHRI